MDKGVCRVKTLLITSIYDYSGKTMVALGVAKRLQADGFKVGYMKALGRYPTTLNDTVVDSDAAFMYEVLELDDPLEFISPVIITQDIMARAYGGEDAQLEEKIIRAHSELSKNKDAVIVGWAGTFNQGNLVGVRIKDVVDRLDAHVIVLYKCEGEIHIDDLLPIKDLLGDSIAGVVFNQMEFSQMAYVKNHIVPFLATKGLNVLGIFMSDPIITSVTIRELADALGGRILCCEHRLDDLVERFSVGAMNVEGALRYFRKVRSKAVITGGDRPDIQLAALETDTRCLILTGNLYPNDIIIARAEEREVPIMVVEKDTLAVVQQVEDIMSTVRIRGKRKIERAIKLVDEELNFPLLYEHLQMKRG